MKGYLKIFTMLFVFLTVIMLYHVEGYERSEVEILASTFSTANADLDFYNLQFCKYYDEYVSDELLLKQGNAISVIMGIAPTENLETSNGYINYVNTGSWETGSQVKIGIKRSSQANAELYLIFELTGDSSLDNFEKDYYRLSKILQDNLNNIKINSCIQGSIYGNLDNARQYAIIEEMLQKIDAEKVESFESDLVKSVSAYSNDINNYIWSGDKKMNFQVSTHYNNIREKTILTMGTPIINIEY